MDACNQARGEDGTNCHETYLTVEELSLKGQVFVLFRTIPKVEEANEEGYYEPNSCYNTAVHTHEQDAVMAYARMKCAVAQEEVSSQDRRQSHDIEHPGREHASSPQTSRRM
mmetsp:Transcript_14420/g.32771  ORF Transcript_14420/g.32771 Transcript_14420/m.32771 type:complete len:112 (-) Transcript_14420:438-773(-)